MKEALFLVVAVLAFTAAVFAPSAPDDATTRAAVEHPTEAQLATGAESNRKVDSFKQWSARGTTLDRSSDGHFYTQVAINGTKVQTLVDTGASVVALTGTDAQALGVSWNDADVREIGRGASGPVMGVPVTLDRVELGGHEATNVSAVVIPKGLGITLLGQSFLSTIDPVRIEDDRMILGG